MAPGTPSRSNFEEFNIEELLRDDRDYFYRSGSAPPTVDGSRAAAAGLFRPHAPAYPPYYYNERMPPPSPSREDWRGAQSASSLFSVQPGIPEGEPLEPWRLRGTEAGLGSPLMRADRVQEDFGQPTYISGHQHPSSRNAFDNIVDPLRLSDWQLTQLRNDINSLESMHSGATSNGLVRVRSLSSTMSDSFASAQGASGVRSTSPDPRLIRRAPSPCLQAVGGGRVSDTDKKILSNGFDGVSSGKANWDDMSAHLSGLKLSNKITEDSQNHLQGPLQQNYPSHPDLLFNIPSDQRQSIARSNCNYRTYGSDIDFVGCDPNAYSVNQATPLLSNNRIDTGANLTVAAEGQYLNRSRNQVGSSFQVPVTDPSYAQYLQRAANYSAQPPPILDTSLARNYQDARFMDLPGYQEAYLGALLAQQKLLNDSRLLGKAGEFDNGLYGNPAFGLNVPYPNQLSGPISPFGPVSSLRPTDRMLLRGAPGGSKGSWNNENDIIEESMASTLLEELKNNKTKVFELSEIVGHVVEFSGDQYGSRFIQQKLETASVEEKNSIFPEILPNARVLMTDVFGNYVIQKFFEYGTEKHRNQLTDALMGFVLPLSLQMYGCRVIQKALEVADVDKQTRMVTELDGSIMKCVRDQNGNHVIQKCIECVPQEKIQFIISSFYGQVIPLSTHPYGCRVIQRVLEHCDDEQTQSRMMEEILKSVCTLAQDQYGNYVIQHVLQHGKPEERASIINKLTGQIVKMSQQKYASNVVEKCLAYSTPEEREILIEEMLGTTEDNEPLQAMMKDQFGNYVVQKVLEYCDDQKLQLIISRIKVHLTVLKKYTYGKHIVARVEKLIATGERRIGMSANSA